MGGNYFELRREGTDTVVLTGYGYVPRDQTLVGDFAAYRYKAGELVPVAYYRGDGQELRLVVCGRPVGQAERPCFLPRGHEGGCR